MDRDKADFFQVRNPSCVSSHQACPNSHTLFEHIKRKTGKLDSQSNSFLVMKITYTVIRNNAWNFLPYAKICNAVSIITTTLHKHNHVFLKTRVENKSKEKSTSFFFTEE